MTTKKLSLYAPSVLRIGISLIYLWFGFQQVKDVTQWVGFIPPNILAIAPFSAETLVYFNGAIEIFFGTFLLFGFFSRASAIILGLHMAHITFMVGYDAIGVRDFGIVIATVVVAMFGPDRVSIDWFRKSKSDQEEHSDFDMKEGAVGSTKRPLNTVAAHTIETLVGYIKSEQENGASANSIRDHLFLKGWTTTEIDSAYAIINQKKAGFSDYQA